MCDFDEICDGSIVIELWPKRPYLAIEIQP